MGETLSIVLLGEAWGADEERERMAFVGYSGQLLNRMLAEADIDRSDCFATNVINARPKQNKIEDFCGSKEFGVPGFGPLTKNGYLRREFEPELIRLSDELDQINPNLVICFGNTACWAMLNRTAITKLRGTTILSTHTYSGVKLLPTYHPAAVGRQWELRPTVVMDLIKAKREAAYPDIRRPARRIFIPETVEDIHEFFRTYLPNHGRVSVDIETAGSQVTCIGFAPRRDVAITIPIVDNSRKGRSYWPSHEVESKVWAAITGILGEERILKTFQNGLYDIAFLARSMGIVVLGAEHDTMLLHHALQPEALKGLGYLGSVYTDEGSWKQMRTKHTTIKRDD